MVAPGCSWNHGQAHSRSYSQERSPREVARVEARGQEEARICSARGHTPCGMSASTEVALLPRPRKRQLKVVGVPSQAEGSAWRETRGNLDERVLLDVAAVCKGRGRQAPHGYSSRPYGATTASCSHARSAAESPRPGSEPASASSAAPVAHHWHRRLRPFPSYASSPLLQGQGFPSRRHFCSSDTNDSGRTSRHLCTHGPSRSTCKARCKSSGGR